MHIDEIHKILDSFVGQEIRGQEVLTSALIIQSTGLIQIAVDIREGIPQDADRGTCLSVIFASLDCLRESVKNGAVEWWFEDELPEDGYPIWGLQEIDNDEK